ncbi:MAG: TolC family protein [Bacteroidetes bacterium]|nr:TolC family protein [Bacteroidota bacterium]
MKTKLPLLAVLIVGMSVATHAQSGLTLSQCVDYAIKNNTAVKNGMIDNEIADNSKKELLARGLPQVDAGSQLIHNFVVQKIILENGVIAAFTDPTKPAGGVLAFQLQLNNVWTTQLTASQVIFDKSLFTGIANADIYKTLSVKMMERTQIDVAELVTKSYYGVLVAKKQLEFLDNNVQRVDSLFREAQERFKNGLVRQIAVDRIEVRLNNLKEEREKAQRLVELNMALLRFQMNMPKEENLTLSDILDEAVLTDQAQSDYDYTKRIEYDILQNQIKLSAAQTKALKDGYYPRLSAFATTGYNPAATHLGDIFQGSRYFNYTYVGLDLRIPVFHGFEKKYKVQSRYLEERKLDNSLQQLQKSVDLQVQQAGISLYNNLESLKIQKRNMELALENVRISRIENQKGIATNIEVINAEGDLKEAQTNYYTTLYNALIAKTDLEKARGTLLKK